ncbi:MAG: methyltransferase [Oscillospiraceae bacterium]|nr:methyltransferase [Oscillospiraceae bacterium]
MILWEDGPVIKYEKTHFMPSMDSALLVDFAKKAMEKKGTHVMDLGCGMGLIPIIIAWDLPHMHIDGIEILTEAAHLAQDNIEHNGLSDRIDIINGDIRKHKELFSPGFYDYVISNPPYYAQDRGKASSNINLRLARSDENCSLDEIIQAAKYLTKTSGAFFMVFKPERLNELFHNLSKHGFEPKRLRFVQHDSNFSPSLVLLESRRSGKPGLTIEAPLLLNCNGIESDEIRAIYKR